jgi:hypothetical protein
MKTNRHIIHLAVITTMVGGYAYLCHANCLKLPDSKACASQNDEITDVPAGYVRCWVGANKSCPQGNSPSGYNWLTVVNGSCSVSRVCEKSDGTQENTGSFDTDFSGCKKGGEVCTK